MRLAKKRAVSPLVLKYNHFFIKLLDGSDRHLLFTDKQIREGIRNSADLSDKDKELFWIHEIWYDGLVSKNITDIRASIKKYNLPISAKIYSHIRAKIGSNVIHLLFKKNTICNGIKRAIKFEKVLPKLSWINDKLQENSQWENCLKVEKRELEPQLSLTASNDKRL
jgi:hypothetical protein